MKESPRTKIGTKTVCKGFLPKLWSPWKLEMKQFAFIQLEKQTRLGATFFKLVFNSYCQAPLSVMKLVQFVGELRFKD